MSTHLQDPMARPLGYPGNDWRTGANLPAQRRSQGGGIPVLPLLGLAALGVVVLGGLYFGPDLLRYMKIRNM